MNTAEWLSSIGLSEYAHAFELNHVDMDVLRTLSEEELKEIGVASLGHRKRILSALASDESEKEQGTDMNLKDGMWFHPDGGFAHVPDLGDKSPWVVLAKFVRRVAMHQPVLAQWITAHYPSYNGKQGEELDEFYRKMGFVMITECDWLVAWRGTVYTREPTLEAVSSALVGLQEGIRDLGWPDDARIVITDIANRKPEIAVRWGTLQQVHRSPIRQDGDETPDQSF